MPRRANCPAMKVSIFLDDEQTELLEVLADQEHRSPRQQATVLLLKALELFKHQRESVAV